MKSQPLSSTNSSPSQFSMSSLPPPSLSRHSASPVEISCQYHQIEQYPDQSVRDLRYETFRECVGTEYLFQAAYREFTSTRELKLCQGRDLKTWSISVEQPQPHEHIDVIQKYHLSNLFTTDFTVSNDPAFLSKFVTRVRSLGLELFAHYDLVMPPIKAS